MKDVIFRKANINDIDFLVETIIEAEKAGTDVLPYSKIFELTELEIKKYLKIMLAEEVDGCELSISSFLVAEKDEKLIAASCAWIEGAEGVPSSILKGNLLNFILPKESIVKALKLNKIIHQLQFEFKPNTIHFGVGYVTKVNRGHNLLGILKKEQLNNLSKSNSEITEAFVEIFANNIPAIRTNKKLDFEIVKIKETSNLKILRYLPYNQKILMKKEL